jgi:hypothetical protein
LNECVTNSNTTSVRYFQCAPQFNGNAMFGLDSFTTPDCSIYNHNYVTGLTASACQKTTTGSKAVKRTSNEQPWLDYNTKGYLGYYYPRTYDPAGITNPYTECEGPVGYFTAKPDSCAASACTQSSDPNLSNVYTEGVCY